MRIRINYKYIYIVIVSFVFSVLGTLASRETYIIPFIKVPYLYTLLQILCFIPLFRDHLEIPIQRTVMVMLFFGGISAITNSDKYEIVSFICLFFIFSYFKKMNTDVVLYSILGTASGQILFMIRYGITDSWNGNSVCAAMMFMVFISFFAYKTKITDSILIIIAFLAELIVFLMSSRTSLISFSIAVFVLFVIRYRKSKTWPLKLTGFIVLLIFLIYRFREKIYMALFKKWDSRGFDGSDLTTGRSAIWINELTNDWTFWGHGSEYFNSVYHHNDAHNIFVQTLGRYGVFVLLLFVLFMTMIYIKSFKLNDELKLFILPIMIIYVFLGMFENVLFLDCKMYIPSVVFILSTIIVMQVYNENTGRLE